MLSRFSHTVVDSQGILHLGPVLAGTLSATASICAVTKL